MSNDLTITAQPSRPLLLYDGDCGFCRRWVARCQRATRGLVAFAPFQDEAVGRQFPGIPLPDLEQAVHLILPDGSVCRGAEAVVRLLAAGGRLRWLAWLYVHFRLFAWLSEFLYRQVAGRRRSQCRVSCCPRLRD